MTLFRRAMDGSLRDCPVRGVAWRYFLGALSGAPADWVGQLQAQRKEFDVLCDEHCVDPTRLADAPEADLSVVNPLSCDEASPYQVYFASSALREEIEQDLRRLHPGVAFYVRPDVQRIMLRILFVWARMHPAVGYRQGMHELVALLVSVHWDEAAEAAEAEAAEAALLAEAPALAEARLRSPPAGSWPRLDGVGGGSGGSDSPNHFDDDRESTALLGTVLRGEYVEAATWASFAQLMRGMHEYFDPGAGSLEHAKAPLEPNSAPGMTPLLRRCARIQGERLVDADPTLHARMVSLGIEPQLYLLRWLRLLFGREFHTDDVKVVWDAIFAYGRNGGDGVGAAAGGGGATAGGRAGDGSFTLVEDFSLAMLMYVREDVLRLDFTNVMKRLLKYPPVGDVHFLVERSLQLRRSHQQRSGARARAYPQPEDATQVAGVAPSGGAAACVAVTHGSAAVTRAAMAAAAASATATAATSSLADPWNGSCSGLRQPPEWPPPPEQQQPPQPQQRSNSAPAAHPPPAALPPTLAAVLHPPDRFAKPVVESALNESLHAIRLDAPPQDAAPLAGATPRAATLPSNSWSKPTPRPPASAAATAVDIADGVPTDAPAASPPRHVQLAGRLEAALGTLNAGLRRSGHAPGTETIGFVVGSAAHERVIAALDELEAVRRAVLDES